MITPLVTAAIVIQLFRRNDPSALSERLTDTTSPFDQRRRRLVDLIARKGIRDSAVLDAIGQVPREEFVPDSWREEAYQDTALPIESGQTISQPFVVALMAMALRLKATDRVLEVGTGSGYAAAVLSRLAADVYTVERDSLLTETARCRLHRLGFHNVHCLAGDGTLGCLDHAPFDAIAVAAAGPKIPDPLKDQLRVGGRIVMPVGGQYLGQKLLCAKKLDDASYEQEHLCDVRFVPLIGQAGWRR
jgi:protein-L-isoaspartate(D-aspartate) O-methyltransferase